VGAEPGPLRPVAPRLLPALIFCVTAVAFLPALGGQFLDWDDFVNFVANPYYRGLGWAQIRWMFTTTLMGHYIPLTWTSLGVNYVLGGMNPWGYHLGNLLLHASNATLVYLIARRLIAAAATGGAQGGPPAPALAWASALGAVLFGVHPLRVESVAWITERRDVLCGLFFLLSVLAYLKGVEGGGRLRPTARWLSLGAFAAALLSKAAAMPLPAVLLLLDVYPLRRRPLGWRRLLSEKLLYVALAAAAAVTALIALRRGVAVTSYDQYGVVARVGMVAYSILFYPIAFLWPMHLSPMYELPAQVTLGTWPFLPALLGLVSVTGALVLARRRWPAGLAAWMYSALMVLPVSGVVHSGSQLVNDRYSYLSGLGFALLGGAALWTGLALRERGRVSTRTAGGMAGAACLIVVLLGLTTWTQAHAWRDPETLWRWAVDMDPTCALCHGNLGAAITSSPTGTARLDEAEGHLRRALALRPDSPIPHFNLGTLLLVRGQYAEAEAAFRRYGDLSPGSTRGQARLGLLAIFRGQYAEAVSLLGKARGAPDRLTPAPGTPASGLLAVAVDLVENDPGALALLGQVLVDQGHPSEAVAALRRAVALTPGSVAPRFTLVQAYRDSGRPDLARQELSTLRTLDPVAAGRLSVR
jgi:protein O-mannosyl-transferase